MIDELIVRIHKLETKIDELRKKISFKKIVLAMIWISHFVMITMAIVSILFHIKDHEIIPDILQLINTEFTNEASTYLVKE